MKHLDRIRAILSRLTALPLSWLGLSWDKRLILVAFSYILGIVGLWLIFPPTHNGVTMFIPIICACWLFRYWGLLASMIFNGIAFQVIYVLLLRGLLPDQDFQLGAQIGFATSLLLGIIVCWLRTAVDAVQVAREQTQAEQQAHMLTILRERQISLAYEQQFKINTLKDQFLLNVNHELRTPLTVLGGYLELLDVHLETMTPTRRSKVLKEALRSNEELLKLVDQVLDATRIMGDIPEAKPEEVNLQQLIELVLAERSPDEKAAYTILLSVSGSIHVWADPQFLRQILNNLFSNIGKYVPSGTEVRIEAEQSAFSDPVHLSIQDYGPGIPPEELPLLFEKFVRLKRDMIGSTRGTGLGLYISKRLIEAMNGRIWIESSGRAGEGSRFCMLLPPSLPPD